ncbi:MAG: aspartate-semialdehyde dehydrogenase, partial [Rhodobacteraceae bacterium]|nr:aspartate-semialdehyde dehydrogenase [Paracoccaceae bacterium]
MAYNIVVVGATGKVGREMLNILSERDFPVKDIVALASRRSIGTEVSYGGKTLKIKDLEGFNFS